MGIGDKAERREVQCNVLLILCSRLPEKVIISGTGGMWNKAPFVNVQRSQKLNEALAILVNKSHTDYVDLRTHMPVIKPPS